MSGLMEIMAEAVVTTRPMRDLLRQDAIWVDRQGATHSLDDIDERYARNIIGFLERRAWWLLEAEAGEYMFGPEPSAPMANDAFHAEHSALLDEDPGEWLAAQALVVALKAKVIV